MAYRFIPTNYIFLWAIQIRTFFLKCIFVTHVCKDDCALRHCVTMDDLKCNSIESSQSDVMA